MTTRHEELEEQAKAAHHKHPIIWEWFVQLTEDRIEKGFKYYSAKAIIEQVRWHTADPEHGPDEFKINDNYTSFYARWFMIQFPKHKGFFRLRRQISKDKPATKLPPLKPSDFPEEN